MAGAMVPPIVVAASVDGALWTVAAMCLVCAVLAQSIRTELDTDLQAGQRIDLSGLWRPIRLVMAEPKLRRLAAVSTVFSAVQMSLATYLVTYLSSELGLTLVAAGVALSVSQTGGIVGRILWGWLADHWISPLRMLAMLALLMGLCALGAGLLPEHTHLALLLPLLALFGASATGWNGVYLAEVARQAPAGSAGVATGGTLAFTFLGVVIGPMLFGMAAGAIGSFGASYLLLALPALACAWLLATRQSI